MAARTREEAKDMNCEKVRLSDVSPKRGVEMARLGPTCSPFRTSHGFRASNYCGEAMQKAAFTGSSAYYICVSFISMSRSLVGG